MAKKKKTKKITKSLVSKSPPKVDFVKELAALGAKIEGALKSAVKSKAAKDIGTEAAKSIKSVSKKLISAVESARKSEEVRGLEEQAKKVFRTGKKQGTDSAKQAQANLSAGLKGLSQELEKLAKSVKKTKNK
ncbi:MAG: hypothetical protein COB53_07325 [Elusimicrobia bacterium]|nr:MAG: hypothetical protein COB53_07325 [Elusimicrobiota bacterium]